MPTFAGALPSSSRHPTPSHAEILCALEAPAGPTFDQACWLDDPVLFHASGGVVEALGDTILSQHLDAESGIRSRRGPRCCAEIERRARIHPAVRSGRGGRSEHQAARARPSPDDCALPPRAATPQSAGRRSPDASRSGLATRRPPQRAARLWRSIPEDGETPPRKRSVAARLGSCSKILRGTGRDSQRARDTEPAITC